MPNIFVLAACIFLVTVPAGAQQGNVIFNNRVVSEGIAAPVYDQFVGGNLLAGTDYRAQLYGGPVGTPEHQLQPTGAVVDFRTGTLAGYVNVGADAARTIPGVPAGNNALVQIRAWVAAAGATYEKARTNLGPGCKIGRSNVITITTPPSVLWPPASLSGLQSFAIQPPTMPAMSIIRAPANLSLFWPGDDLTYIVQWPTDASSYELQYSTEPGSPSAWQTVYPAPSLNGNVYSVRVAAQTVRGFFRLKLR